MSCITKLEDQRHISLVGEAINRRIFNLECISSNCESR
jgi:hypothetical protein